jgi:hypothetical protein
VSVQTNIEGKCAWSDETIYTRAPIYIMVIHKEAIYSTGILATLKSKLTQSEEKENCKFKQFKQYADICDGEDYCYFIINNHLPRVKCYRSTFTITHAVTCSEPAAE